MAKTNNGLNPKTEQLLIANLIDRLSREFIIKISNEINRAMREGAELYLRNLPVDILLLKHEKNIKKILNNLWDRSQNETLQVLTRKKDAFLSFAANYNQKYGGLKITEITSTTLTHTKDAVNRAIEEGLSIPETAKLIRHHARGIRTTRAKTIARTEISTASAYANEQKAIAESEELGVEYDKEWIAADDERTRETHAETNGQVVAMNEFFIVGGEELSYACDPAGSAENIINCRCTTVYVPRV